jgi:outer membrane protein assembly factor BamB
MMLRLCRGWLRGVLVYTGLAATLQSCGRDAPPAPAHAAQPAPVAEAAAASAVPETDLAVLPNNTVIYCSRGKLVALREGGEVAWELAFPQGDSALAAPAVALNSLAYVRGNKFVHAAAPDGKWLWSHPIEGRSFKKSRVTDAPVALSDSSVAIVVGDDIVCLDLKGAVRWRVAVPEGHVNNRLVGGMDGSVLVSTTAGVYSINPEGKVAWRRVLDR